MVRFREDDKLEQLCLDFDEDCVLCESPPFGSFRRCWDYDRTTGFCPFCLPRD
ncbi:MAG TPA: hypothetical protein VM123_05580 [archaeon]|nr:hypothetical protein [archaeon]